MGSQLFADGNDSEKKDGMSAAEIWEVGSEGQES